MVKAFNLILAGMLLATNAVAETLIKESEARLPPAPVTATATRSITRGPGIRILSRKPEASRWPRRSLCGLPSSRMAGRKSTCPRSA